MGVGHAGKARQCQRLLASGLGDGQVFASVGAKVHRLTVVSYGEERPVCDDSGESCWSQNRRVELVYSAK